MEQLMEGVEPDEPEVLSDEVVIEQVRKGDTAAFENIMRRYNQRLYRIARSVLNNNQAAEDAVQQAYLAAFSHLGSYKGVGKLGAWLGRITINEALMIKRKPDNRIVDKVDNAYNENLADATTNPAVIYDNIELARLIEISIDKLPADFRSVFVLRSIQQLSTTETADTLGINEATVKTRLHRARNLMQGYLNQYIEQAGMQVFEFAGKRCDRMVKNVLHELHTNKEFFKGPEYLKLPGKFQVL